MKAGVQRPNGPKVFCIGFQKTGTTSLKAAFESIGYRVAGPNGTHDPQIGDHVYDLAARLVPKYEVFQDNPWPLLYQWLDEKYPGSKFILTVRDPDKWLKSVVSHFGGTDRPMLKWIYGAADPVGNEEIFIARYTAHNHEVLAYFKDREDDLLVLDLSKEEAPWSVLAGHVGFEEPGVPFPHANSEAWRVRHKPLKQFYSRLRSWGLVGEE